MSMFFEMSNLYAASRSKFIIRASDVSFLCFSSSVLLWSSAAWSPTSNFFFDFFGRRFCSLILSIPPIDGDKDDREMSSFNASSDIPFRASSSNFDKRRRSDTFFEIGTCCKI